MTWQEMASASHYQTAVAIADRLSQGQIADAQAGIQELIDAVARSEKRALRSQLVRLMLHVLKWKSQPEMRSSSWATSICQAREEIASIQEEVPNLNRERVQELWDSCLRGAATSASGDGKKVEPRELSWQEVFETDYYLGDTMDADEAP